MNTQQLIAHLRSLGIRLWIEGDQLRFSAAPGALDASLRSVLSERREEIITWLRDAVSPEGMGAPAIVPVARTGNLPLSFAQQRLWFFDQFAPENASYNVPFALRFRGPLDQAVLQRALDEVLARHEVLRTSFRSEPEGTVQVIGDPRPLACPLVDLRHLPSGRREAEAQRLAAEEAGRCFDLSRGPMLRGQRLCLGEHDHVLLITLHHIVSDGWSLAILDRELRALYDAFRAGEASTLPPLPIQYADFAVWQRQWLQGDVLSGHIAYWKRQLAELPTLELPTDRPRPTLQTFRGARVTRTLPKRLRASLQALARDEGATLFMTVLAVFKVLLHRYSGQTDIVVGTPIANRTRSELEDLIGFFANNLVMRTDASGNPSFRELLARVKEMALEAYEHQDMPFEKLVEELEPERELSRNPLFQVSFALQEPPIQTGHLGDCTVSLMPLDCHTTHFDLEMHVWDDGQTLTLACFYSTDLFAEATIERMVHHLETLLEDVVADPNQRTSELQLMSPWEKRRLLIDWNRTATDFPRHATVHALFEAQAARTPEAVAVAGPRAAPARDGEAEPSQGEDAQLTYVDLNARANQLARCLRRHGVGPEVMVGLCVDRSPEMVVGMLGILKAGGAYVPLEPTYPKQRLSFMIRDADAPVLVTRRHLRDELPAEGRKMIFLDADEPLFEEESRENVEDQAGAENLAYVIYTSGSTGRPKGVCVEHRSITRLVCETNYIDLSKTDRMGQASNASFDAATFEVWGALVHGARLCIVPRGVTLDPHRFRDYLRERQITVLFLTTALFNQMAREAPGAFEPLRYLLFGGEAVNPEWVRCVLGQQPPRHLLHVYGPTEGTTFSTYYHVEAVEEGVATVPIGRPLSNTEAYVLDATCQPVPVGVPGELYIGGDGLARGYWNQDALTEERFVPHPFRTDPSARLYRTGDRVRYRADGAIDFLGRIDDQVKIRGFRVEPGEIEATFRNHPGVSEVAVLCREDEPGQKRLVAYVVGADDHAPSITELRDYARKTLPDYMIPSALLPLAELPLTPNGKIDREALLGQSDGGRPELAAAYVAARSPVERQLAAIWCEVLELDQVGIHDDFFELGGHSLLATLVVSRIKAQMNIDLPIRVLFERPTIAGLAAYLGQPAAATDQEPVGEGEI